MSVDAAKIVGSIANDILALAHGVLNDYSLRESDLYKNIDVLEQHTDGSVVVSLLLDNYAEFIDKGRKPMSGRKPPIDALRDWALARNIPIDNPTLWAISTAIQRHGYEARPILSMLEQRIESYMENEWSDMLFDTLSETLNEYFD